MSGRWRSPEQYRADEVAVWERLRPSLEAGAVLRSCGGAEPSWKAGDAPVISSTAVLRLFAAGRIVPVLSGWVLSPPGAEGAP